MSKENVPPLRIREADGSPNAIPVYEMIVSNGTLTDLGGGRVGLATGDAASIRAYASTGGSYLTFSLETDLTGERNLLAGMGIQFADSGANSNLVLHPDTALLVTSSRAITTVYPISGGGNLSLSREFAIDTAFLVNTGRTISAGAGLSGGGDLSANRTISLVTPVSVSSGGTGVTSLTSSGILYGGGTAAIQVLASMHSGSLIVGSGINLTPHIFGVGSQGQMLTADSSKLAGLLWVNTAGGASAPLTLTGASDVIQLKVVGNATQTTSLVTFEDSNGGVFLTIPGLSSGYAGSTNNFIGSTAGNSVTSGTLNNFFGESAGTAVTTGAQNVVIGAYAGRNITTENDNIFIGYTTGDALTGASNVIIGSTAGDAVTTVDGSVVIGFSALGTTGTGDYNTIIGASSNAAVALTGSWNISIGYASNLAATAQGSIVLGCYATGTASNQLLIGGDGAEGRITSIFIGENVTDAAPPTVTMQTTGGVGTNIAGSPFIIASGKSTGTAVPAVLRVQTGALGTGSGTTAHTLVDRLITGASKTLTNNSATALVNCTIANDTVAAGCVRYAVEVTDGTDVQIEEGIITYHATNKAGTIANNTTVKSSNQQAMTAGTLTVTWTTTAANPTVLTINANSSLTPSSGFPRVTYSIENLTQQAIAIQ